MRAMRWTMQMLLLVLGMVAFGPGAAQTDNGCRTGGAALADAYILAHPFTALLLGDPLPAYLERNASHFGPAGDAVRCAAALSSAYMNRAVQLYDPGDLRRRQELETQMRLRGIEPRSGESSPAAEALTKSMELAKLARTLPAAAAGDLAPLRTPANQLELMQAQALQLMQMLMQDPAVRAAFQQTLPLYRDWLAVEHRMMLAAAQAIAEPAR